jgi:hypothetical protein
MIFKWVKVNSVWTHSLWTWSVYIQTNLGSPTKFSGAFFVTLLWTSCGIWTIPHYGLWADACIGWSSKFLLNIESTPIQLVAWNNPFKLRLYMMETLASLIKQSTQQRAKGRTKGKDALPAKSAKTQTGSLYILRWCFVTLQVTRVIIGKILSSMLFVLPSELSQNHSMGVVMHVNYLLIVLHTHDLFHCTTKMPFQNLVKHWPS